MSYEVRVWHEDGTLMGVAEIAPLRKRLWQITFSEVDQNSGYAWQPTEHSSQGQAERYAQEWAEGYVEWLDTQCECEEASCGCLTDHGYSIQYCRDGYTVDAF